MNNVNQTLYIPLYGKALVSRKGILLHDPKAEQIWSAEGFPLKGKSRSKWLAYYMGMRSAVFDRWLKARMDAQPDAVVLHLGCGLDSRAERVGIRGHLWYDVDFPEVISERRRYFRETGAYKMLSSNICSPAWLEGIPGGNALVVLEGVSMYLLREELSGVLSRIRDHFDHVELLMDCYTEFAAKASAYKNPINDVGVTRVFGLDDPHGLAGEAGVRFCGEHEMTPEDLICELHGMEQTIFRKLYAGRIAHRMYRLYEFASVSGGAEKKDGGRAITTVSF